MTRKEYRVSDRVASALAQQGVVVQGNIVLAEDLSKVDALFLRGPGAEDLSFIEACSGLSRLDLSDFRLAELPPLPESLVWLSVAGNQIEALPPLPPSLTFFSCEENCLTVLPDLPRMLEILHASYNRIAQLPELPPSLEILHVQDNKLTSLPPLPPLSSLNVNQNPLSELPPLPRGLLYLYCGGTCIKKLTRLPSSVLTLSCPINELSRLPKLPACLQELECSDNKLTRLPTLPGGIRTLRCSDNKLRRLPVLPCYLFELKCDGNPLRELPVLPASLHHLCISSYAYKLNLSRPFLTPESCAALPDRYVEMLARQCREAAVDILVGSCVSRASTRAALLRALLFPDVANSLSRHHELVGACSEAASHFSAGERKAVAEALASMPEYEASHAL